jgi:hypothetical protein
LSIPAQACVDFAAKHTWEASAQAFIDNMADIRATDPGTATTTDFVSEPRCVA